MRKQNLDEPRSRFSFSTEENYLRLILQSYSEYNHKARLDIAEILYKKFLETPETEDTLNFRKNLFAEILHKMMQTLEDSALLAIMFMDKRKTPLEHFVFTDNRMFINFFRKARRGLSDNQILRIYGLEPPEKLLQKGYIKSEELQGFKNEIDLMLNSPKGEKRRWKGLGKLYTEPQKELQTGKKIYKKSSVVSVYHNIKHAYKVLIVNDIFKKIWSYRDTDPPYIAVIENYDELGKRVKRLRKELRGFEHQKMIFLGTFEVTKETVKQIYSRIYPQVQTMKFISDFQLGKLDDPTYSVREFRYSIYKNNVNLEPKHYQPCPCGSGKKFKKCHRSKDYTFIEGLTFKNGEK